MASLTSALPLTGLYPYVALMVVHFDAAPDIDHAGYYSGFIVSAFMIGRLLTSYSWGSIADRIGRKPVVAISCFAITILSLLFGMSVNLWMAILTRLFLGFLNPLNSVVKTMTSEICTRRHQPIAMSVGVGAWSVGLVIGPSIGGTVAAVETVYPSLTYRFRRGVGSACREVPWVSLEQCSLQILSFSASEHLHSVPFSHHFDPCLCLPP
jgi:MFS family permease